MRDKAFSANDLLNLKILMATEMLIKLYKPILIKYNLSYSEYVILIYLWRAEKLKKEDFTKELYVNPDNLDVLLSSLEESGYLMAIDNSMVEITDKGIELWGKIEEEIEGYPLCNNLFKDEYGVYIDVLSDIIQNLNDIQYRVIKTSEDGRM